MNQPLARIMRSHREPRAAQRPHRERGFTLLEVMIAVGVLGVAMLALLALHDSNLRSVIRGQELSTASELAQGVMTHAELERFPVLGTTAGNFESLFPGVYPNFRWQRVVATSGSFPDIREVHVTIYYGPSFGSSFSVVEFLHDPQPQAGLPGQSGALPAMPGQGLPPPGQNGEPPPQLQYWNG